MATGPVPGSGSAPSAYDILDRWLPLVLGDTLSFSNRSLFIPTESDTVSSLLSLECGDLLLFGLKYLVPIQAKMDPTGSHPCSLSWGSVGFQP